MIDEVQVKQLRMCKCVCVSMSNVLWLCFYEWYKQKSFGEGVCKYKWVS